MLLFAVLLLAAPTPDPVNPYLLYAMSLAGFVFGVWSLFRRESREDRSAREAKEHARLTAIETRLDGFTDAEALESRIGAIEKRQTLMAAEVTNQHNTLHEMQREHDRVTGRVEGSITQLQKELHLLEPMPSRVASLEAKFDTLNERITNLKEGLLELRDGQKENKKEILDAIKQMKS